MARIFKRLPAARAVLAGLAVAVLADCSLLPSAQALSWTLGLRASWLNWSMSDNGVSYDETWTWRGVTGEGWEGRSDATEIEPANVWGPELAISLPQAWDIRFSFRTSQSRLALSHSVSSEQDGVDASWEYAIDVPVKRLEADVWLRKHVRPRFSYMFGLRYQSMSTGAEALSTDLWLDGDNAMKVDRRFARYDITTVGAGASANYMLIASSSGLFSILSGTLFPVMITSGEADVSGADNNFSFTDVDGDFTVGGAAELSLGYTVSSSLTMMLSARSEYFSGTAGGGDDLLWNISFSLGVRP